MAIINGTTSDDSLFGTSVDDVLDGGAGNDLLVGGLGNDTYLYDIGGGQDAIFDYNYDTVGGGADVVQFGVGVLPANVTITRGGYNCNDLILAINGTADSLTIRGYFEVIAAGSQYWDQTTSTYLTATQDMRPYAIEEIRFADGTVWTQAQLDINGTAGDDVLQGTTGDDVINGLAGNDQLMGDAGHDTLNGGAGDDTLNGGSGNDTLDGGAGNDLLIGSDGYDTYIFGAGSGQDTLELTASTTYNQTSTIQMAGLALADVTISRGVNNPDDLVITVNGTNDTFTIKNYTWHTSEVYFQFSDTLLDWQATRNLPEVWVGTTGNDWLNAWGYSQAVMNGNSGDDHLNGTQYDDVVNGGDGNDTLSGGMVYYQNGGVWVSGNDTLDGGAGDDTLQGMQGNDTLIGGTGNDTYWFNLGDGQDTIQEYDWTSGNVDTVRFGPGIAASDITFARNGMDLVLGIGGTTDQITIQKWGWGDAWRVERFVFADGTVWDAAQISAHIPLADTITGSSVNDSLSVWPGESGTVQGLEGDDSLFGGNGNDTLIGGAGNDVLSGGLGNDIYVFNRGDGQDSIIEYGGNDTIRFGAGIAEGDITFARSGMDLVLGIAGTTDQITIQGWGSGYQYPIDRIEFADGTVWDQARITAGIPSPGIIVGTSGNDALSAWAGESATLQGLEGDDFLYGNNGADTLIGGTGNDYLSGGSGDDVYVYNLGDGQDRIVDDGGNLNTIKFGAGIAASDITGTRNGDDLVLCIAGTTDQITIQNWAYGAPWGVERIEFADGTIWDAAQIANLSGGVSSIINGTEGADTLYAPPDAAVVINGNGGDDLLVGGGKNDTLNGGAGNDTLDGGMNSVWDPTAGAWVWDPATQNVIWDPQAGNYVSVSGSDTLDGGAGNDLLIGRGGMDTYVFGVGSGQDTIDLNTAYSDGTIQLTGLAKADVTFSRIVNSPNDLVLSINGTTDSLTILGYYWQPGNFTFQFADGTLDATATQSLPVLMNGTDGADTFWGDSGPNAAAVIFNGNGGDDQLVGGRFNDTLNGGAGNDTLDGGVGSYWDPTAGSWVWDPVAQNIFWDPNAGSWVNASGSDVLDGGAGNDLLIGRGGWDTYVFGVGSGQDTIDLNTAYSDGTIQLTGLAKADVTFSRIVNSPNDLVLSINGTTDSLTILGYYWQPGNFTFQFADGTLDATATQSLPILMNGTEGADTLSAYPDAAVIFNGNGGDDQLVGGGLNDTLNGGAGNDTLDGGMGWRWDPTAGNWVWDPVTQSTIWDPQAGNSVVASGSDVLDGGAGNDLLIGRGGWDTYVFGVGSGQDTIDLNTAYSDGTIQLTGLAKADVTFSRIVNSPNDLVLSINGTTDSLTILGYYMQPGNFTFQFADGTLDAAFTQSLPVPENRPPVAAGDNVTVNEDGAAVIAQAQLLANDSDPEGGAFSISGFDPVTAQGNTVTQDANGNFVLGIGDRYQPLGTGQTATDTFSYTITDAFGATSTATVNVTITGSNDAPIVAAAIASQQTNEDALFTFTVPAATFSDIDNGDVLTYTATLADGSALPGWMSFDAATQTFSGTPANGDVGSVNVQVTATDLAGASASATFALAVQNVNDAPIAADDSAATNENAAAQVAISSLLANDHDIDVGDTFALTGFDAVSANGNAVTQDAMGNLMVDIGNRYQALAAGQTATDSFTYTVTDTAGATSTATVTITINGANDGPVTQDDAVSISEDTALAATGNVLANDSDVDQGTVLAVVNAGTLQGNYGSLVLNADGTYSYALNNALVQSLGAGQLVTETFTYQATDGIATTPATLTVTINGSNDAPMVTADTATVQEDLGITATGNVLSNDSDVDQGTVLSVGNAGTYLGSYGTLTLLADGSYSYALDNASQAVQSLAAGQIVTETFAYQATDGITSTPSTLTVSISGSNDAPVVVADTAAVQEDINVITTGNVLANDSDVDLGAVLTIAQTGTWSGQYGQFTLLADGSYTYALHNASLAVQSLAQGETVTESFVYAATDGVTGTASTITFSITGSNDAPLVIADTTAVTEDLGVMASGNVLSNDSDVDHGALLSVANAGVFAGTYGQLVLNADGSYTYALDNASPAVQALASGQVVTETFTYQATDGITSTASTLTVSITGTNDAPVVVADTAAVQEDLSVIATGNVLTNDSDVDQGTLLSVSPSGTSSGLYGQLTLLADGSYTYALYNNSSTVQSLAEGETVTESFVYQAVDGMTGTVSTISFTISGSNDAPVVVADIAAVVEDLSIAATGNVLANDSDVDRGTLLSVANAGVFGGTYGQLVLNADGTYTYGLDNASLAVQSLVAGQVVTETFTYQATDGLAVTSSTLTIRITGANDAPVVVADTAALQEDLSVTVTGNVLSNDGDVDQGTVLSVGEPGTWSSQYGQFTLLADGNYTYALFNDSPAVQSLAQGETVTDAFVYQATDGASGPTSIITFTVTGTNDVPVVASAIAAQQASEDALFSFAVPAATFTDVDHGDLLTYSATMADGTALPSWLIFDAATQTFSGTPGNTDVGNYSVTVSATDTSGLSASATFVLDVANVNDAPTVSMVPADQTAQQDAAFSFTIPAGTFDDVDFVHSDSLTYSVTLVDGTALPGWLTFDAATQTLSGIPANGDVGTLGVRVTATDMAGASVSTTFALNVQNVNDAPVVSSAIAAQQTNEDAPFSFAIPAGSFTDVDRDDVLGYSATLADGTALPSWLVFDAATQTFSGTPANGDVGSYSVVVRATDLAGLSASSTFTISVANINDAPVVSAAFVAQNAIQGQAFAYALPAGSFTDVDQGDALTYTATLADGIALPTWLTFDAATLTFSGTPDVGDVASLNIVVTATDSGGLSANSSFALAVSAPVITGTGGTDSLTGTVYGDTLYGLAGNDTLNGGTGNDTLDGGTGADTMKGGLGDDIYVVDNSSDVVTENSNEGADTVQSAISYTLKSNVENLTLTGTSTINGTGNSLNNVLDGSQNTAANVLTGGSGNDTYILGAGDTIVEYSSGGTDTVMTEATSTLGSNLENLTLTGSAAINGTGNSLNNVLTGNGADNVLNGRSGSDTMSGGAGDDTYVVDTSGDIVIENLNEGTDTVQSRITYTLGANVENLTLTGSNTINGTGNTADNILTGNSAANTLTGGAGNDLANGDLGNDVLKGDAGNDILRGGDDADTLSDTAGANLLDGGAGDDSLTGNTGNEMFVGGAGNDFIDTGDGADILAFNRGDGMDVVNGGIGSDNTISLGGGISYADIALSKVNNDLILEVGNGEQITLSSWYDTSANYKSVIDLQVMADAMAAFDPASSDPLLNQAVQSFDFAAIVNAFDQANGGSTFMHWSATNAMLAAHLAGSDTMAIGGDLAHQYGTNGSLTGMNLTTAQAVLNDPQFGVQVQGLNPLQGLQGGTATL